MNDRAVPPAATAARYRYLAKLNQRRAGEWSDNRNEYGMDPASVVAEQHRKALRFEVRARLCEGSISPEVAALALRLSHDWQGSAAAGASDRRRMVRVELFGGADSGRHVSFDRSSVVEMRQVPVRWRHPGMWQCNEMGS